METQHNFFRETVLGTQYDDWDGEFLRRERQKKQSGCEPFDFFLDVLQQASTLEEATSVGMQGVMFHEQTMIDSVVRDPIYLLQTDSRVVTDSGLLAEGNRNIQNESIPKIV